MAEDNKGAPDGQQIQLRIMSHAEIYQQPPNRIGAKLLVIGTSMDGQNLIRIADVDVSVNPGIQHAFPMVMAHLEQRLRELKLLPTKSGIEIVKPGPAVPPLMLDKLRNGR